MVSIGRLVRPLPLAVLAAVVTMTSMAQFPAAAATDDSKSIFEVTDSVVGTEVSRRGAFDATIRAGRRAVREQLRDSAGTSAAVALVAGKRVVWRQGFGQVNAQGRTPSASTRYGIGSVSKVVTTMAVQQLVDAGKLSLDAPVVRYVPDFRMKSPQYRQITVRMLLNHSAGLPGTDYANAFSFAPIPGYSQRLLRALAESQLKTTPGSVNVYCNDCFTLAGIVVERVANQPFTEYVTQQILDPLGMDRSGFLTTEPLPGDIARVSGFVEEEPTQVANVYAAGGLVSTTKDMTRLARVFLGAGKVGGTRVLSRAAVRRMAKDQTETTLKVGSPDSWRYGLGWDTVAEPGLAVAGVTGWNKSGDTLQHHASFMIAPNNNLAVIVLTAGSMSSSKAAAVGRVVLLNALTESGEIARMPADISGPPAKRKPSKKQVRRITGTYLASGLAYKVSANDNRVLRVKPLVSEASGGVVTPGRYRQRADGAFWSTSGDGTSIRSQAAWGRKFLVKRSAGDPAVFSEDLVVGQKVRGGSQPAAAWDQRVNQSWLLANEDPESAIWAAVPPAITVKSIPGLQGYLLADGMASMVPFNAAGSSSVGTMFLTIPYLFGRDMFDVAFTERGGDEWLSFASSQLRPASTVPRLAVGQNSVRIGAENFAEWRKISVAGTLRLVGQQAWKIYDQDFALVSSGGANADTADVPADSYVATFGDVGTSITLNLTN